MKLRSPSALAAYRQGVGQPPPLSPAWQIHWGLRMSNQKVVLITGASSGVGQSTAQSLSQKGHKVFGTSRNPAGAEVIPAIKMLGLDVRSDDSVTACVKAVSEKEGRIDV